MKKLVPAFLFLGLTACGGSDNDSSEITPPKVVPDLQADVCYLMATTMGDITLAIDLTNMPVTGKNFKDYVDSGFYDGTLFHRVAYNFVIQGGGFTTGMVAKPGNDPIVNEADVGISNERGTIAMARTTAPDSATSQFFINVLDNPQLDASSSSYGYAVFGKVVEGIEIVDQINIVDTGSNSEIPVEEVIINSVTELTCPVG
ncbi:MULTISPECIES: peptidylprolyl isomerase [Shewanella]|uniref:Peptidyl-prolyl cis-trans isomerase n=1 Tax=Shewanella fidelis TaxID=173509 RepID=A0AAW8NK86_9GAMM|nr:MULTISPECIES: peptidylprolyl isomerase [Shewanella]MDR8523679.1 peptidylprolyl isomerase [Shewanella fidelis]MDW4810226.1 peptidylprolyl isomerase [Shewanella fidelis]MDW4814371.1 peptidylprolyl isomerase [Shewanella fidelis]MDW4818462.1 peptidylprolyl isomerase [Shewanella fidelis]MDW4823886.1 peptidylprolyl isomerase [Shewanella fidelis]